MPKSISNSSTCFGVAPFCGANTLADPRCPHNGLSTSQAIWNVHSLSLSSKFSKSIVSKSIIPIGPFEISIPFLSKNRAPKLLSIPIPPSVVAEPPIPMINSLIFLSKASLIISPTPKVVAFIGSKLSFISVSPLDSLISIIASLSSTIKYLAV